jgi:hypothetical protein
VRSRSCEEVKLCFFCWMCGAVQQLMSCRCRELGMVSCCEFAFDGVCRILTTRLCAVHGVSAVAGSGVRVLGDVQK